jgi:hypothetical protein
VHVSFEHETGLFSAVALTGGSGAGNHEAAVTVGSPADPDRGPARLLSGGDPRDFGLPA